MAIRRLIALCVIGGALLGTTGCVVPQSKYDKLKADHDRLTGLPQERESELVTAQDTFRQRVDELSREIELYKQQATGSKAEAEKARQELAEARKEYEQYEKELEALKIGAMRDGKLVLEDAVLFALGSANLSPQGRKALDKLAAAIKGKDALVQIDGHTDNTPIVKDTTKKEHGENMGLSVHRALAVYRHLRAKGVKERHMYVRGFGESWPYSSNASAAGKAKNRRVEIKLIPLEMVPRPKAR
jgi:chemotaxis protein MotB